METKDILLRADSVYKSFSEKDSVNVLDNISMNIYRGDFTVIMGASGAGKSTLLYALSGMDSISGGKVEFSGTEISGLNENKMVLLRGEKFGFVFQQTHLVSNLTLLENVVVAGCSNRKKHSSEIRERAEKLLAQMNVEAAKNRLPSQVSGGEAQRAAIARAMINDPEIIFADEPTGALNKSNSEEVLNLLTKLNKNGQSILMVTHDIRGAIRGNRLLYLEDGKILDELELPVYGNDSLSERESKINGWLSSLRW